MVNVTEEVRRDVMDVLTDLKEQQPPAHRLVYEEIIKLVKWAKLLPSYDHG